LLEPGDELGRDADPYCRGACVRIRFPYWPIKQFSTDRTRNPTWRWFVGYVGRAAADLLVATTSRAGVRVARIMAAINTTTHHLPGRVAEQCLKPVDQPVRGVPSR
jgi:hypothetical protein